MFDHAEYRGHERVLFAHDAASGLRAIVAIHDSTLGPAFGGCRMWPYRGGDAALTDALRLSRGMTYKAAICELPWGGGKSVIIGDPSRDKTPALLRAMGRVVASLGGRYVIADDVGTTLADLAIMRTQTEHTAAASEAAREPLAVTAYGVLQAILATAEQVLGRGELAGLHVAVQGLGNVGMPLCALLHARGAMLTVTDVDPARIEQARHRFGARAVTPHAIFDVDADLLAPCALGGVLDDGTVARLAVRAVCGGANNQLCERRHDAALARRGIVFVPDYLANAGGVIDFNQEFLDDRPQSIMKAVERIHDITVDVLERARSSGATALDTADAIVESRLRSARRKAVPRAALERTASAK